jgi:hypothetical protein
MKRMVLALTLLAFAAGAEASPVSVSVTGIVSFNGVPESPLGDVGSGEQVTMSFTVDSDDFTDGIPGDTRGYVIDETSFSLGFSGGVEVGVQNPFPAGTTPYFTLVDGFPVSDGFFVSTSNVSPGGVPLSHEPYNVNLDLGYVGETLSSLDILDAVGVYDFDGLTRFSFTLWRVFPDNVQAEFEFSQLVIEAGPTPVLESSWGRVKSLFE